MNDGIYEIEAVGVVFYSQTDEGNFFNWLDGIPCVESRKGYLRTLKIFLSVEKVDEENIREILALYKRYRIDMRSLVVLDREEYAHWFRDKDASWYSQVFAAND